MENQEPDKLEIPRNPDGTFPKGVSGNPKGRPRVSLAGTIREALSRMPEGQAITYLDGLIKVLIAKGFQEKDVSAIRELLDRGYGKPNQPMSLDVDDDIKEVSVKIVRRDEEPGA